MKVQEPLSSSQYYMGCRNLFASAMGDSRIYNGPEVFLCVTEASFGFLKDIT